jgi:hypothetical protein
MVNSPNGHWKWTTVRVLAARSPFRLLSQTSRKELSGLASTVDHLLGRYE